MMELQIIFRSAANSIDPNQDDNSNIFIVPNPMLVDKSWSYSFGDDLTGTVDISYDITDGKTDVSVSNVISVDGAILTGANLNQV